MEITLLSSQNQNQSYKLTLLNATLKSHFKNNSH